MKLVLYDMKIVLYYVIVIFYVKAFLYDCVIDVKVLFI